MHVGGGKKHTFAYAIDNESLFYAKVRPLQLFNLYMNNKMHFGNV